MLTADIQNLLHHRTGRGRDRDHDLIDVILLRQAADIITIARHLHTPQIFSFFPRVVIHQTGHMLVNEPTVLQLL